jgi:hypothetical protein
VLELADEAESSESAGVFEQTLPLPTRVGLGTFGSFFPVLVCFTPGDQHGRRSNRGCTYAGDQYVRGDSCINHTQFGIRFVPSGHSVTPDAVESVATGSPNGYTKTGSHIAADGHI